MSDRPGAGFERSSVEVFGHEVLISESGSGDDVLVICPGSAGSDASWAKDILAGRLRVVELNGPGWGGTPPLQHRMDQRELAVIMAAAVEKLGVTRYHLHGASMGGVTVLWLAAQFPERVRTLSLEGDMNFVRPKDLVSPENGAVLAEMVATNNPEGSGYPRAAPHPRKPWADDEYIRGQMRKRIPMMRMLDNSHQDELQQRMARFAVPTLVLLGDQDELLLPSHLDRWRELLPSVDTRLVVGGAHDIQNTEPEVLADALGGFFSGR
ncbi:MAG: alpha/beta hydrolase fold protein [Microbacteriaceae bacterium]|nr:alpha/beta hydrolase fold protein [Microbacteriaceae bacterium]